jgi:hypothetical protein
MSIAGAISESESLELLPEAFGEDSSKLFSSKLSSSATTLRTSTAVF